MAYLDDASLAQHRGFRDRVLVATMRTAVAVAAKAPSNDASYDAIRASLATNVLNDPLGNVERFAWAVITEPTIASSGLATTDGDLDAELAAIWDAIAGV